MSKKQLGFTLIEMMFVVLLLGVILVHIAKTQQEKNQALAVERTVRDLNYWTQALVTYYQNNNSQWPNSLSNLTTTGSIPALMPTQALCSVFTTSLASGSCGNYSSYSGSPQNTSYYILSINTPSQDLAKQVASKLQNAWITAGTYTVNTAIPAPYAASSRSYQTASDSILKDAPAPPSADNKAAYQGWIVAAGVVSTSNNIGGDDSSNSTKNGTNVPLPNCPPGFDGHIITSPINYVSYADSSHVWGMHLAMVTNATDNPAQPVTAAGVSGSTTFYPLTGQGPGWASYIDGYANQNVINYDTNHQPYVTVADRPVWKGSNSDYPTAQDYSNQAKHLVNYMTFCLPISPVKTGNSYSYGPSNPDNIGYGYSNWFVAYGQNQADAQCSTDASSGSTTWAAYRQIQGRNITNAACSGQLMYPSNGNSRVDGWAFYFSGTPNTQNPSN